MLVYGPNDEQMWWNVKQYVSVGKGYVGIRCIIFIHATFCKFEIISK